MKAYLPMLQGDEDSRRVFGSGVWDGCLCVRVSSMQGPLALGCGPRLER